jgi:hypothetical protein
MSTSFDAFLSAVLTEHIGPRETWVGSCGLDRPSGTASKGAALSAMLTAPLMSKHFGVLSNERLFLVEVPAPFGRPQMQVKAMDVFEFANVAGVALLGSNIYLVFADGSEAHFVVDPADIVSGKDTFVAELTKRFSHTPPAIALHRELKRNDRLTAIGSLVVLVLGCAYAYYTCDR